MSLVFFPLVCSHSCVTVNPSFVSTSTLMISVFIPAIYISFFGPMHIAVTGISNVPRGSSFLSLVGSMVFNPLLLEAMRSDSCWSSIIGFHEHNPVIDLFTLSMTSSALLFSVPPPGARFPRFLYASCALRRSPANQATPR